METMANKIYIMFLLSILLFSSVFAYSLDSSYVVTESEVLNKGIKQFDPIVWVDYYEIDSNGNRLYHIDSKITFSKEDKVTLKLYYEIQPDWIKHRTHSGKLDKVYYPSDWVWFPNCVGFGLDSVCSGGWVEFEVYNIEESRGSSTFPIGITGPQWNHTNDFYSLISDQDYSYTDGVINFNIIDSSFYLNISYDVYYQDEQYESEYTNTDSFWNIDLTERHNLYFMIFYFIVAIGLIFVKYRVPAAFMLLIGGFLLLFSGVHFMIALVPLLAAVVVGGMLYGFVTRY
jgi:hypothetical protein